LDRLAEDDERWDSVHISGLVKIAQRTSAEAVSYALTIASLTHPVLTSKTAYPWLNATARSFREVGVE
jgi:hypothetical protein